MNSLSNPVPDLTILPGGTPSARPAHDDADDIVEDYLDCLCTPLVGIVPFRERHRLREEAAFHIERLANVYMVEGVAPEAAAYRAIEKYGASHAVGQQFLEAWFRHQPQGRVSRLLGLANTRALTYFGFATFLCTSLVQWRVYNPDPHPMMFGLNLAQIRRVIPEPLPLPDANPLFWLNVLLAVAAPVVAGGLVGASVPVRPARAVYQVQILLTCYTFVLGAQMLPTQEGLQLALFQLFFWLPVGCCMAHVAAALTTRRRCRFIVRSPHKAKE